MLIQNSIENFSQMEENENVSQELITITDFVQMTPEELSNQSISISKITKN